MVAWAILEGLLDFKVLDRVDAKTAAAYEQPVSDALAPLLSEKYGLGEVYVHYTRPGQFIPGHRLWDTKEDGGRRRHHTGVRRSAACSANACSASGSSAVETLSPENAGKREKNGCLHFFA